MDELHRRILQTSRSFLVNNIEDVAQIVDHLYEKDILTEGMRQDIMQGEKTTVRQVRKLLDFLPKRGPFAFDIFCNALILFKQRHIAEQLNPTLINQGATPLPPTTDQNTVMQHPAEYIQQPSHNQGQNQAQATIASNPQVKPTPYPQPMSIDIHKKNPTAGWPVSHGQGKPTNQNPEYGRPTSHPSHPEEKIPVFKFPDDWPESLNMAPFNSRDFEVESCSHMDIERIKRQDIYRMCSTHHGKAIIINNQEFSGAGSMFAKRSSSEGDSNRLQQVLQKLAFQVHIWRDLNYDDMTMKLKRLSTSDHDDAFILVILSYGGDGTVFCEDGRELKIQDIINIFSSENCRTLRGRPKLIFIQACGTKLKDTGNRQPESEPDHEIEIVRGLEKLSLGPTTGDMTDTNPGPDTGAVFPVDTSDTLVAMATSPDIENRNYGSLFILAVAYVFCHCSKNEDLRTMLHRINQLQKDRSTGRYIKLCEVRSALKQKFFFLPGYPLKGSDPSMDFPSDVDLPAPSFCSTKKA